MGGFLPRGSNGTIAEKRILLVDDEAVFRRLYADILTMKGFEVTECEDGSEALDEYMRSPHKYDLIITDYIMPALNGLQLADKIREIDKSIPIILCTGYTNSLDLKKLEMSNINAILSKPLTLSEFESCIENYLS